MKNFAIIFCLSIFLICCKSKSNSEIEPNPNIIDVVAERTDPKSLDLTKQQLYIDTTKTSDYYDYLESYKELNNEEINELTKSFKESTEHKIIANSAIDKKLWVSIKKYNGQFVLLQRCGGKDEFFGISNSLFFFLGYLEPTVRSINQIDITPNGEITFSLNRWENDQLKNLIVGKIENTNYGVIKRMTIDYDNHKLVNYVVPVENIREFELLVNNCPDNRWQEADIKFEE